MSADPTTSLDDALAAEETGPGQSALDRVEGWLYRLRWAALLATLILVGVLGYRATLRHNAPTRGDTRFYQCGAQRFWAGQSLYYFDGPGSADLPPSERSTTAYTYLPPFAASLGWTRSIPYVALRGAWLLASLLALYGGVVVTRRLVAGVSEDVDAGEAGAPEDVDAEEAGTREAGTPEAGTPEAGTPGAGAPSPHESALSGGVSKVPVRQAIWLGLLALLLGRFVVNDLGHGQVNAFLALLLGLGLWEVYGERPLRGGIWIGLALVIKPTSWLLLPWLLGDRRWRALGAACAAGVGALLLSWALYPGDYLAQLHEWFELMPRFASAESVRPYNASLASTIQRLLAGSVPSGAPGPERLLFRFELSWVQPFARAAATALALAGLLAALWQRKRGRVRAPRAAASVLALSALLSPITWKAHFVVLLAPVAFLAWDLASGAASRRRWGAVLLIAALFLLPSRGLGALGLGLEAWGGLSLGLVLIYFLCLLPPRPVA